MGRYVEQKLVTIKDADQAMGMYLNENRELVFYISSYEEGGSILKRCILYPDSEKLVQTPMTWGKGLGDILDVSENEDGTTYFVTMDVNSQARVYQVKDDRAEVVSVPNLEQTGNTTTNQLCGVRSLTGGDFLLLFGANGASYYSGADISIRKEYPIMGYNWSVSVYNGKLLAPGLGKNELLVFDLKSGEQEQIVTFDSLSSTACQGMNKDGIYVADMTGIYRQNIEESNWEKIVDGNLTSLSLPSVMLGSVTDDGADGFFVILSGADGLQVIHYVYDPNVPTVPDTTLTIFGLKDNSTIRQTIGIFQQQNPNIRIDFQIASEGASSANIEDIIRTLNTELLNGKGPDILLLDGLPVGNYMEKGVLMDLTDEKNIWIENGLMKNLMNAYEYEGHCYGIPSRFTIPVMIGEKSALASIRSLDNLVTCVEANQNDEMPFLTPSERLFRDEGMMLDYYDVCSSNFVKENKIDEIALNLYLSNMLRIQKAQESNFSETDIGTTNGKILLFELMGFVKVEEELFYIQEIMGENVVNMTSAGLNEEENTLEPAFGGTYYTPRQVVGITSPSSASKQQELALQFINLLFSQSVQDVYVYDGFPVNSRSLDTMMVDVMNGQEEGKEFRDICNKLDTPIFVDQVVKEAVQSQLNELLDGMITLEDAVSAVIDKTKLYLSE